MIKIFPFIFIVLWSSAFITTKPIIDNSDPFAALAFRFFFVAVGFLLFSIYSNYSIVIKRKNFYDFETDIFDQFKHLIEIENFGEKL